MKKTRKYASILLRYTISLLILWFGINQTLGLLPQLKAFIPSWTIQLTQLTAETILLMNGISEIILGTLLLIGLYTRITSSLIFLHLLTIAISLGYTPIAIRDYALALSALTITLQKPDKYTLDYKIFKK